MSDLIGTTAVLVIVAVIITAAGLLSVATRGPLKPAELHTVARRHGQPAGLDPVAVATASELDAEGWRADPGSEVPVDPRSEIRG